MAGSKSGRVEANWQALISAPPSEAAVSSTRFALRWCCNSQSRGCTREGNHFARSRRVVYPTKISAATVASTRARARDCPTGTTRVACSCTWSPASVQRKAFERARSARRTRNRAGLCVSPSAEKAAHVSSIACLTALSSIHCFFIVSPGSALLLPLSFLVLVFQRDFAHVIPSLRSRAGSERSEGSAHAKHLGFLSAQRPFAALRVTDRHPLCSGHAPHMSRCNTRHSPKLTAQYL